MKSPCKTCDRKGCGSYHDKCPEFKAWKDKNGIAAARRIAEQEQASYAIEARIRVRGKHK